MKGIILPDWKAAFVAGLEIGAKWQHRMVIRPQPEIYGETGGEECWFWKCPKLDAGYCHTNRSAALRLMEECFPLGSPGDVVRVKEAWLDDSGCHHGKIHFRASETSKYLRWAKEMGHHWHPALSMPLKASRSFSRLVSVGVERLQEITPSSTAMEGVIPLFVPSREPILRHGTGCRGGFIKQWDHDHRLEDKWERNPWVWVAEFEKAEKP